jgi:hypothetical protein
MIETVTQGDLQFCTAGNAVQAKRRGIDAGGFSLERDQWRHFQADRSGQGLLTLFFPRVAKESLGGMKLLQKGAGIGLMLVGGYLISR